ncbi:class I SAM-dependent methyltransferase [Noviherbaspirillum denitrificans]|uniref:C-methyltransferase domain-containing protein n=1 Tax=Noviherbaspirillum denitrificans TaxID=1968433 RepID=A0A254TIY6_9BURK|nr:class I SAM-dependent methyltransferase [Noviherbaspirillum denitrificans]OWW21302.1 hypothetical protein AYR66_19300 [Noviherbaspirillum denitrificans]
MYDEIIFSQPGLPVFQNKVYPTRAAAQAAVCGDVELVQCRLSGLVFNRKFNPGLLDYDADYQNEQACSPAFKQHLDEVLEIILRHFGLQASGVEIGCGKGYFFDMLDKAGASVIGFDPAYEGNNPRVVRQYFGKDALSVAPDYVVLRHVLEHIPSPWAFLEQIAAQCKAGTKIYIEVPCFDWIVSNQAFYDVFYEHVNYFTRDVLAGAFGSVIASGHFFGGQYLYLVADLSSFRKPVAYQGKRFAEICMDAYFASLLRRRRAGGGKSYIWGAGAKGITFANLLARQGVDVDAMVDINPAKQGRFAGGTGLPILSPDEIAGRFNDADVFVMNPVYLDEIKASLNEFNVNVISVA